MQISDFRLEARGGFPKEGFETITSSISVLFPCQNVAKASRESHVIMTSLQSSKISSTLKLANFKTFYFNFLETRCLGSESSIYRIYLGSRSKFYLESNYV